MNRLLIIIFAFVSCFFTFTAAFGYSQISGVGNEGQGAGIAIYDIDGNGINDAVIMAYDNPSGQNSFRYKIGWNIKSDGNPQSWSSSATTVNGVSHEGQGAGIAIANFDTNSRPDMILMAYDTSGEFRYKIGWNLTTSGTTSSWSPLIRVSGMGRSAQGAGVAVYDIDGNGKKDIILMIYDNPSGANSFRYKIGWNIGANGQAERWNTNYTQIAGVGHEGQGADVVLCNLDSNPRPEMILMAYDKSGEFRYKIGWNMGTTGFASTWSAPVYLQGAGMTVQGSGLAVHTSGGNDALYFMIYDNPSGANSFRLCINNEIKQDASDSSNVMTAKFSPAKNGYLWMQNAQDWVSYRTAGSDTVQFATSRDEVKIKVTSSKSGAASTSYFKIQPYRYIKYKLSPGHYKFQMESGSILGAAFPSNISELSYKSLPKNRPDVAKTRGEYGFVLPYFYWNEMAKGHIQARLNFYEGLTKTKSELANINLYAVGLNNLLRDFGTMHQPAPMKNWVMDQIAINANNGAGIYFEIFSITGGTIASEFLGAAYFAKDYLNWTKQIMTKSISASINAVETANYLRTTGNNLFYHISSQAGTLKTLTNQELNARNQNNKSLVFSLLQSQIENLMGAQNYVLPSTDPVQHSNIPQQPLAYEAMLQNYLFKRVISDNASNLPIKNAGIMMEGLTAKVAAGAIDLSVIVQSIKDMEAIYR